MPDNTESTTGSITGWTRLEPQPFDENMADALQARLHDPLWLLARQWQLGEFQGEDAGSPVDARLEARRSGRLSKFGYGELKSGTPTSLFEYDHTTPLDARVEHEPLLNQGKNYQMAAETGRYFLQLLGESTVSDVVKALRPQLLDAFPLTIGQNEYEKLEPNSRRTLSVLIARVIDGDRLYEELTKPVPHPLIKSLTDDETGASAVTQWEQFYEALYAYDAEPKSEAWDADMMDYNFAVAAHDGVQEVPLEARHHRGGRLDWHAFDYNPELKMGAIPIKEPVKLPLHIDFDRHFLPTPLTFKGMPNPRYWEFERGEINLGRIDAAPEDLSRLLLVEFMLVYGNDFFSFPLEMQVGSVVKIASLTVTDTFGSTSNVPPSYGEDVDSVWSMFTLTDTTRPVNATDDARPSGYFFLSPTLVREWESPVIEDVGFLRDETANMCWAVERTITSPAGRKINRYEEQFKPLSEPKPAQDTSVYGLIASSPPANWFPLVPMLSDGKTVLKEGTLYTEGQRSLTADVGAVLAGLRDVKIPLGEVPREGLQVTRSYHYARWTDGSTHLWISRQKRPGRGEGSSGLRYDRADQS